MNNEINNFNDLIKKEKNNNEYYLSFEIFKRTNK